MSIKRDDNGLITLSGVFGVCGVRNNNKRVYETANYSKMVSEMQGRIKNEGSIPGELEHPQMMNITLENISHKITDISIDENGVVTGTIALLNTPKGKIAQAIVEGGLPLFISSRATGNVDQKTGAVTLERISTYDLVGTPGFSQAKLHLNENQIVESVDEGMFYIIENTDKIEENNIEDMELKELFEKFEALESRVQELEAANEELLESLEEAQNNQFDLKTLADGIQKWIIEEYSPIIQEWITEEYHEEMSDEMKEEIMDEVTESVQDWATSELADCIQNWVVEEYSEGIQNWITEEVAPGIQDWVVEEFSPEIENWIKESYEPAVTERITESVMESVESNKESNLNAIDETLQLLEGLEASKPTYQSKTLITEHAEEPIYLQNMPAEARVKWDLASPNVKESIMRRAKLYNFTNEGAIGRFWQGVNFEEVPTSNVYEGLQVVEDERERNIRMQLRGWKSRRG
jgi:phenylpyruvate tautomerase PptA (4-oxalocrotonate tautomerase family)